MHVEGVTWLTCVAMGLRWGCDVSRCRVTDAMGCDWSRCRVTDAMGCDWSRCRVTDAMGCDGLRCRVTYCIRVAIGRGVA